MSARTTEITIRKFLIDELQRRKLKLLEHPSYATPRGRMEPDILLEERGNYVVETKLGGDLFTAFAELNDYLKYIKVSGGFAVILPEELRTSAPIDMLRKMAASPRMKYSVAGMFSDARPVLRFEGTLDEITDWISHQVLAPPEKIEVDTSLTIRVLRNAVSYISASTRKLKTWELEDIFGGRSVFENILQYEEKNYPLKEMQEAAAYLLINQIMFYHVLTSVDPVRFEPIDEESLSRPASLNKYFERVLKVNYTPVFGFDIASRLPVEVTPTLKRVVGVTKALKVEKIGYDILGKIFHDLIPFEIRKAVAAFYTNNEAAELLAHLAIDSSDAKVADLAVGSGTLLVSSYKRKRSLLQSFGPDDHKRFLTQDLTGIDIMPFAAHLAVVHLSLQSPQYKTDKVRVAVWDSTELKPGRIIPAIAKELKDAYKRPTLEMFMEGGLELGEEAFVKKGVIASEMLGGDAIPIERIDVAIMNPPFTRQERMPREYKDKLLKRFDSYRKYIHGQLGLYGYFIFLADRFLKDGGRIAFVLPATVLRIKSCEGVRKFLSENFHIKHIITTHHRSAFSESVRFREILLVAEKTKKTSGTTKITVINKLPKTADEALETADKINEASSDYEDDTVTIKMKDYRDLKKSTGNWFKHIVVRDPALVEVFDELTKSEKLAGLSSIGEMIRGYELRGGDVTSLIINTKIERAIKSKDIWVLSEDKKKSLEFHHKVYPENEATFQVPKHATRKTLRRASGVKKIDATDELDYIVLKKWDKDFERFQQLTERKLPEKLIASINKDVENRLGNLFIVRRLDLSAPRTHALAFYSSIEAAPVKLLWSMKIPDEDAKILSLYLNSTVNLLQTILQRAETRGAFLEVSEYILQDFLLLDPKALNKKQRNRLLTLFQEVKDTELPSLLTQLEHGNTTRKKIDKAILEILGYQGDIESTLTKLYNSLSMEINILKENDEGKSNLKRNEQIVRRRQRQKR